MEFIIRAIKMALNFGGGLFGGESDDEDKENFVTIAGMEFQGDTDARAWIRTRGHLIVGATYPTSARVNIPHGVTITSAVLFGSNTGRVWFLKRAPVDANTDETMASANHDTVDNSIVLAVVDNFKFVYYLTGGLMGNTDEIHGARITFSKTRRVI